MEAEELAKEYTREMFHDRTDIDFHPYAEVFDSMDIEDAFKAGRQSVIDNIPDLEWYEFGHLASVSQCLGLLYWIGRLMRGLYEVKVYGLKPDDYTLPCRSVIIGKFKSFDDAKRAANEDYKERIKQVLEL